MKILLANKNPHKREKVAVTSELSVPETKPSRYLCGPRGTALPPKGPWAVFLLLRPNVNNQACRLHSQAEAMKAKERNIYNSEKRFQQEKRVAS